MKFIIKRVNAACNFWADTEGLDYTSSMSNEEILEYDNDNIEIAYLVKELRSIGY